MSSLSYVSNITEEDFAYGGRVLDSEFGVADVLPEIVKAIRDSDKGKNILITANGGVMIMTSCNTLEDINEAVIVKGTQW